MISVQIFFYIFKQWFSIFTVLGKKEFYQMAIGQKQVLCHWCHLSNRELGQKGVGLKRYSPKVIFGHYFVQYAFCGG